MGDTSAETTQEAPFTGYAVILEIQQTETRASVCKWTRDSADITLEAVKSDKFNKPYIKKGVITNETAQSISRYFQFLLAEIHERLDDSNALTTPVLLSEADAARLKTGEQGLYEAVKSRINNAFFTKGTRFRVFEYNTGNAESDDEVKKRDWEEWRRTVLRSFFKIEIKFAIVYGTETDNGTVKPYYYLYRFKRMARIKMSEIPPKITRIGKVDQLSEEIFTQHEQSNPGAAIDIPIFLTAPQGEPAPQDRFKSELIDILDIRKEELTEKDRKDIVCRFWSKSRKFAAIIDAGSSGTRMFLYTWEERFNNAGDAVLPDSIHLLPDWNSKAEAVTKGGIAKLAPKVSDGVFKDEDKDTNSPPKPTAKVAEDTLKVVHQYLDPIFEYARSYIENYNASTKDDRIHTSSIPLIMLATGGMRSLKQSQYQSYKALRKAIITYINKSGFLEPYYDTISGKDEGLFGWVAANYNNKRFSGNEEKTRGFMEMGGQSAQIAFVPEGVDKANYFGPLTEVNVGGQVFNVFSKTWNMLGADAVWRMHEEKLRESDAVIVDDPCLPKGYSYQLKDSGKTIKGTGNMDECVIETFLLLGCKDEECLAGKLCVFRGRGGCLLKDIPGLGFQDQRGSFEGASVFWYATNGVFGAKHNESGGIENKSSEGSYNLVALWEEAKDLFSYEWSKIQELRPHQEDERLSQAFFKVGLIMTSLHLGFGVPMPIRATAAVKAVVTEYTKKVRGANEGNMGENEEEEVTKDVINILIKPFLGVINTAKNEFQSKLPSMLFKYSIDEIKEKFMSDLVGELQAAVKNLEVPAESRCGVERTIEGLKKLLSEVKDERVTKTLRKAADRLMDVLTNEKAREGPEDTMENAAKKAISDIVGEFLEAGLDAPASADERFTTRKEASWTLGRTILYAVHSQPKIQTREGWEKPVKKPDDDSDEVPRDAAESLD